jgi:release factor glutamine methyltransferase
MRIADALAASGLERREARLLLAEASGFSQASLIACPERELPAEVVARFEEWARRRREGEPVAYLVGHREFYGLDLAVNPAVLIPRPETELLVEWALERAPASVLDLGTGSGAIALAIRSGLPKARVVAVDASAAALVVARRNAVRLGLDVDWRHGRWFEPARGERFDLVVSNPPYVAEGDRHLGEGDVRYEPRSALVSGPDGLDALREIVSAAPGFLVPGGALLIEHGLGQDAAARELFGRAGFAQVQSRLDLAGIARVMGGALQS